MTVQCSLSNNTNCSFLKKMGLFDYALVAISPYHNLGEDVQGQHTCIKVLGW